MPDIPTENTVYCLHVTDVCKTANADIVSFEFGKIKYTGDIPTYTEEIDKKYPFLLKQTREATEEKIGVYPYGAIIKGLDTSNRGTVNRGPVGPVPSMGVKMCVIPCGNISHLPDELRKAFNENGYLETDESVKPSMCHVGDVYTIGAPDDGSGDGSGD